jgi:undecaprenyl-diphosphatase
VTAAAAVAFTVLAVLVAVRWGPLVRLDRRLDDGLNRDLAGHRAVVRAWQDVSDGLSPGVLRTAMAGVAVALLAVRRWGDAVLVAGAAVGTLALSSAVKAWVGRPRPVVPHPVAHAPGASFPSGHALTSAAAALLVLLVLRPLGRRFWRWAVAVLAVVAALAVGVSRLMLGVHYLSDVVGGWLAATVLVLALEGVRAASSRPARTGTNRQP